MARCVSRIRSFVRKGMVYDHVSDLWHSVPPKEESQAKSAGSETWWWGWRRPCFDLSMIHVQHRCELSRINPLQADTMMYTSACPFLARCVSRIRSFVRKGMVYDHVSDLGTLCHQKMKAKPKVQAQRLPSPQRARQHVSLPARHPGQKSRGKRSRRPSSSKTGTPHVGGYFFPAPPPSGLGDGIFSFPFFPDPFASASFRVSFCTCVLMHAFRHVLRGE